MKITNLPAVFQAALPVLQTINAAGFESYFVGGAVRDLLLERPLHDIDIATSAYPEEIKKLFDKTIDTGIKHGTVTVLYGDKSYEITTFRTESGYQDFRRPDHVEFVQNLATDLQRRDFTINALAMDTNGEIIDHFGGIDDLNNRLIKAVGEPEQRFHEDALRMMRALRFMSQLGFKIEKKTLQAVSDNSELLGKISIERIRDELVKLGLGPGARPAFQSFLDTGLYEQAPYFKGKKDQLNLFPKMQHSPSSEASLWALLVVLLKLPNDEIGKFMRTWRNSNELRKQVVDIVDFFDLVSAQTPTSYDLFKAGAETLAGTLDLARLLGQPVDGALLRNRYELLPCHSISEFAVNGDDLLNAGIPAGPAIGKYLHQLQLAVLDGEVANDHSTLLEYLSNLSN